MTVPELHVLDAPAGTGAPSVPSGTGSRHLHDPGRGCYTLDPSDENARRTSGGDATRRTDLEDA